MEKEAGKEEEAPSLEIDTQTAGKQSLPPLPTGAPVPPTPAGDPAFIPDELLLPHKRTSWTLKLYSVMSHLASLCPPEMLMAYQSSADSHPGLTMELIPQESCQILSGVNTPIYIMSRTVLWQAMLYLQTSANSEALELGQVSAAYDKTKKLFDDMDAKFVAVVKKEFARHEKGEISIHNLAETLLVQNRYHEAALVQDVLQILAPLLVVVAKANKLRFRDEKYQRDCDGLRFVYNFAADAKQKNVPPDQIQTVVDAMEQKIQEALMRVCPKTAYCWTAKDALEEAKIPADALPNPQNWTPSPMEMIAYCWMLIHGEELKDVLPTHKNQAILDHMANVVVPELKAYPLKEDERNYPTRMYYLIQEQLKKQEAEEEQEAVARATQYVAANAIAKVQDDAVSAALASATAKKAEGKESQKETS